MTIAENIKQGIEKRLQAMEESLPPSPKDIALADWRAAQDRESEARAAFGKVKRELLAHAEKLQTLALEDVPAWAGETSRLNSLHDAYADIVKMAGATAEAMRIRAVNVTQQPDPKILEMRVRFYNLRQELMSLQWNDPRIPEIDAELKKIHKQLPKEWVEIR